MSYDDDLNQKKLREEADREKKAAEERIKIQSDKRKEAEIRSLESHLASLSLQEEKARRELAQLESTESEDETVIKNSEREEVAHQSEEQNLERALKTDKDKLEALEKEVLHLQAEIKNEEDEGRQDQVKHQALTQRARDLERQIKGKQENIRKHKERIREIESKKKELERELSGSHPGGESIEEMEKTLSNLQDQIRTLQRKIQSAKSEKSKQGVKENRAEMELQRLSDEERREEGVEHTEEEDLKILEKKLREVVAEADDTAEHSTKEDQVELLKLINELKALQQKISDEEGKIGEIQKKESGLKSTVKKLRFRKTDSSRRIEKEKRDLEALGKEKQVLEKKIESLKRAA